MKEKAKIGRIERLELLAARLKADESMTVGGIAGELGVSVRTLSRDIQLLREQGLPIETDVGRGGGVRLDRHWGIGRINLNYSEAVDLLISLAVAEQMESPLFMAHLNSVRHKLMASFSPDMKSRVKRLKSRILIAGSASIPMLEKRRSSQKSIVGKLHQGFLMQDQLLISYRALNGKNTVRMIEPHYLLLSYPIWYIIAWDHLRSDTRTFRCDRVQKVRLQKQPFLLRPLGDFQSTLEGVSAI